MSGREFIECRLELRDLNTVSYADDWNREPIVDKVDDSPLPTATIQWLAGLVESEERAVWGEGLRILGGHLYEKVFVGAIGKRFRRTFSDVDKEGGYGLRLVIAFHYKAESLASLPWEFLYLSSADGGQGTFLAGQKHSLVLTRTVAEHPKPFPVPSGRKMNVLLVSNLPADRPVGTTETLTSYLGTKKARRTLTTTPLPDPTYTTLKTAVTEQQPDVIHIIGHGSPGRLYMRREPEEIAYARAEYHVAQSRNENRAPVASSVGVTTSKLLGLFEHHTPHLVFLQTCHGGAYAADTLDATAVDIVRAGVPAVVAMQYDINADRADLFASTFYKQLVQGATVGEAVAQGRAALAADETSAWHRRDFAIPVVYIHKDMSVVAVRDATRRSSEQAEKVLTRTCQRCGASVRYGACGVCGLLLVCQCGEDPDSPCRCQTELEHPVTGHKCGKCKHPFQQEPDLRTPTSVEAATTLRPRVLPAAHDGFAGAS